MPWLHAARPAPPTLQQCGQVVCSGCSENRKFLESSRSGAPKRICDKCHKGEIPEGDDEDEDGGDAGVKAVTKGVAGASVSDGGATGGAGATAGAGAGDSSSRRPAPGMPPIPVEDSLKVSGGYQHDGDRCGGWWRCGPVTVRQCCRGASAATGNLAVPPSCLPA